MALALTLLATFVLGIIAGTVLGVLLTNLSWSEEIHRSHRKH